MLNVGGARAARQFFVAGVLAPVLLGSWSAPALAQFPRIVPPPPCVVSGGLQVGRAVRSAAGGRAFLIVEPFDVTALDRRVLSIPWALTSRVREHLSRQRGLAVATEGSFERALYESGGSADSAARVLGASWILRGRAVSFGVGTNVTFSLFRRGEPTSWNADYRVPAQTLAQIDSAVSVAVVARILGDSVVVSPPATGYPTNDNTDRALAQAMFTLRGPSIEAADSARLALERVFATDPSSPRVAVTLASAYLEVIRRGGVNPPIGRNAALRRVNELTNFALARDPRSSEAWTTRALAARERDTLFFAGALAAHGKALSLDPRSAEAIHQLGMTYLAFGEDGKAAAEFRRALTIEPERGGTLAALAGIELRAKHYGEACSLSNAAVASAPFDAQAYSVRARARLHLGQTRDAYADAETAAKLSGEPWTEGLRLVTEVGAGNRDRAATLSRELANRYLAAGRLLPVRDAAMLAVGWIRLGDTKRGIEALSRARPKGRLLLTALSDPAFDPIRSDAAFKALASTAGPRKIASDKSASR